MYYHDSFFLILIIPLTMLFYQIMPRRGRWVILLLASYFFNCLFSVRLFTYLIFTTAVMYVCGRWMGWLQHRCDRVCEDLDKPARKLRKARCKKSRRRVLILGLVYHIGLLLVLKYLGFFAGIFWGSAPAGLTFLHPIGISFYTLQGASYLIDVYRGTVQPDRHLGRLALFISFFPQIVEGPICRYAQTAGALFAGEPLNAGGIQAGFQRILFGLFKKIVIADRLEIFVKPVFDQYQLADGGMVLLAMAAYTCQLYMDFSGVIDIAIGTGRIFNVRMPENFRQPFFSKSISEFWTRWHISLGAWLRDYLYYPLSLSAPFKKMTNRLRKPLGHHYGPLAAGSITLLVVWVSNGLWHGSGWQYIFFGLYHFFWILMAGLIEPAAQKLTARTGLSRETKGYRLYRLLRTVLLVNIGELFFRANSLRAGLDMFAKMVTDLSFRSFGDGTLQEMGIQMPAADIGVVLAGVLAVLAVSIIRERQIPLSSRIAGAPFAARCAIYYAILILIIVFGAYGPGYDPVDPMYANF